ncbi:flavodoxin domain-containing protein [Flavobacterium rakeshii]|uniref:diflavin oxidoreductase n=1 Tax=Flavobacterium rakeshii TaxID=1038845 RepID=UPI002E7B5409|nr:flavodoxin domain-containing protein [Flavobacterium rakeshii]MEE1898594.1 flavodoxin domain-containing protein [Flavobacterium rakeshii]
MLSENKLTLLQQLVANATDTEIIWTNGYLTGYLEAVKGTTTAPPAPAINNAEPKVTLKPTILYGTETGNSKKAASSLHAAFKKSKIQSKSTDIVQYSVSKLEKEELLLFVISTQGEGEFPLNAIAFYEELVASNIKLDNLKYAVFGLGDTSYPLFCNAAVLLNEALQEKGAQSILPLVKSDVDYSEEFANWQQQLLNLLQNNSTAIAVSEAPAKTTVPHKKDYKGTVSHKVILNDHGSNKQTYHIEITGDEDIIYEPGDALGIIPKNSYESVIEIIGYFTDSPDRKVTFKDKTDTLLNWLTQLNIKGLSKKTLNSIGELLGVKISYEKADLLDVLIENPVPVDIKIESLLELLLPIAPRLYSISSSAEAHEGQVHLTVNLNRFVANNKVKTGLASQYITDIPKKGEIDFYIHRNNNFRLPDADTDIIMIGPGTGIAPFRSFLAERDITGADGRNWLFFGEQHFTLDFYYQTEIQEWLNTGVLARFDGAFSRDQERKIYVQDRIRENATEFNQWLLDGASIYICGQKAPMSLDVENTIIEVIANERNIPVEEAKQVLESLELEGKYQKDVY